MTSTNHKWILPPPTHVLECIEGWRKLDLRKQTDQEIDKKLSDFLDSLGIYDISMLQIKPSKLWRIRKFHYLFKNVDECWEPQPSKTHMGRCNAQGSPVLYVSKDIETPFEELNVDTNEQVYVIQYEAVEKLNLKRIVPKDFIATDNENKPIYDSESMLSYKILREFVRSEFLKPVGKGTEYLHRISSSMCRVWFHDEESDGWMYPSVHASSKKNIALKPKSARKKLIIKDARIVRLVPKENVKNHINKFRSHPFYNLLSMAVESDFIGEIINDQLSWHPSADIGGLF